jgi:hypothetical protein
MNNVDRFKVLRGYHDKSGYHSQGGKPLSLGEILKLLDFGNISEFKVWYEVVPNKEELINKWNCSGDCCNSLLKKLLQIN